MAKEIIGEVKDPKQTKGQSNSESIDRNASSNRNNIDNGENRVSNGNQSTPPQPGIAKVGNTEAENQ